MADQSAQSEKKQAVKLKYVEYFVPNQVVLCFTHTAQTPPTLKEMQDFLQSTDGLQGDSFVAGIAIEDGQIISVPVEGGFRTTAFATVPGAKDEREAGQTLVNNLYRLYPIVTKLPAKNGLGLSSITVNWLTGGAQGHTVTGGPGAQPVRPKQPVDSKWFPKDVNDKGAPWGFTISEPNPSNVAPELMKALDPAVPTNDSVYVAILDTSPAEDDIMHAYTNYKQPILRSLLAPQGQLPSAHLQIDYAPDILMQETTGALVPHRPGNHNRHYELDPNNHEQDAYGNNGHHYLMSDHGLFVAGIIHTLAPTANLHLYQVLNDYGVGTFKMFASAINQLIQRVQEGKLDKLIINLSLTFCTPYSKETQSKIESKSEDEPDKIWSTPRAMQQFDDFIDYLMLPCQALCDSLTMFKAQIVAAAGNDALHRTRRPDTRYPAAFVSVEGIGALADNSALALYSNFSETPQQIGILTFGGDIGASPTTEGQADPAHGMLGLYIGKLPSLNPSQPGGSSSNGWARWAGTSFSTPVIAGLVASLCGQSGSPQSALQTLRDNSPTQSASGEKRISVLQN